MQAGVTLAEGRRRELNVTIRVLDDPFYVFKGKAAKITLPENVVTKHLRYDYSPGYNYSSGVAPSTTVVSYAATVLGGTVYVLSNNTDASGQRLTFTMSKCMADGNPLAFCERLRTSTSPLFVA